MVELPQLNSCCCGCSLKTGTLIILWLYTLSGVILVYAAFVTPTESQIKEEKESIAVGVWDGIIGLGVLITGGIALYGVYKEIASYLLPFFVWDMLRLALMFLIHLALIFLPFFFILELLGFTLSLYFLLVVYSYYRSLKGYAEPTPA